MAPATLAGDGQVRVPLDEHTRAIAEVAAREAIKEHMATCPIVAEFRTMHIDLYGLPGNKDESPGLMGDVAELKRGRRLMLLALRGAWVVLTILVGAAATAAFRSNL